MNTSLNGNNVYGNIVNNASSIDPTGIYYLINIILFGSVIIFILVFGYNFWKAYRGEEPKYGKRKVKSEIKKNNSMKSIFKENVCENCGQLNELDAKFCKNCGRRLK